MGIRIPRRAAVTLAARAALGIAAAGIVRAFPEARALSRTSATAGLSATDFAAAAAPTGVLAVVKATPEYKSMVSRFTQASPIEYRLESGFHFVSYAYRPTTVASAGDFQLLHTAVFAVDQHKQIVDVFTLAPSAEGTTTVQTALRKGEVQTISHSPAVISALASARSEAAAATARSKTSLAMAHGSGKAGLAAPLAAGCDCGDGLSFYCAGTTCGGGYVDNNCFWLCSLSCYFVPTPWGKVACSVACRGACWVPPYCYCNSYYCGPCILP